MAWRTATTRDLAATLSQREIDLYRKEPDFSTSADPALDLIKEASEYVRGFIRDGARKNRRISMSPTAYSVPESLIGKIMDYVAFDLLKRIGTQMADTRKEAREQAESFFTEKLASGQYTPEPYDESATEEGGAGGLATPQFGEGRRRILNGEL